MPQDILSEAHALILSVLIPGEDVQWVGVAETTDRERRVVAFTTGRALQCTQAGPRREWRSLWWPDVRDVSLAEVEGGESALLLRPRDSSDAPLLVGDLPGSQGRALFLLVETLRHAPGGPDAPLVAPRPLFEAAGRDLVAGAPAGPLPPDFQCGECGAPVGAEFQVCPYCTAPLREGCPSCGREVHTDFTVCPYCAAPLVPSPLDDSAPPDAAPSAWVDLADVDDEE